MRSMVEGAASPTASGSAPSTALRAVPLPRRCATGEDPRLRDWRNEHCQCGQIFHAPWSAAMLPENAVWSTRLNPARAIIAENSAGPGNLRIDSTRYW
jgi:hypothetical protein